MFSKINQNRLKKQQIRNYHQELESEIKNLNQEVSELEHEMTNKNKEFIVESMIRNELYMQKPDEYIVQLPEIKNINTSITPTPTKTQLQAWADKLKL